MTAPSAMDIVRMFGSLQGNIGGVVPSERIVIDIDPRSGGLESLAALTGRHGPFPETPTVRTGGNVSTTTFSFQLASPCPPAARWPPRVTPGSNGREPVLPEQERHQ